MINEARKAGRLITMLVPYQTAGSPRERINAGFYKSGTVPPKILAFIQFIKPRLTLQTLRSCPVRARSLILLWI